MSGFQRLFLVVLSIATAGVFLLVGWLAFGDEISTRLAAANVGSSGQPNQGDVTIWAVGDSLMVSATQDLEAELPGIRIDAEVGRRMDQGIDVLTTMIGEEIPDMLIVALGTNNGITVDQVDEVMRLASGVGEVIFVNVSVPRPWETRTNGAINSVPGAYPNAAVVDWKSSSNGNGGLFRLDGFHLSQEGIQRWVGLITAATTRGP
jgi:hypothetical protein